MYREIDTNTHNNRLSKYCQFRRILLLLLDRYRKRGPIMAHFAEIDENSLVTRVVVVNNNELLDDNGEEQPQKGIDFLVNLLGGRWIQTSYNNRIRKCYAGIGFLYDEVRDVFVPPQRFPSWIFNEITWRWEAPVPYPSEGIYVWDEEIKNWVEPK
jgi:hypothetical protein